MQYYAQVGWRWCNAMHRWTGAEGSAVPVLMALCTMVRVQCYAPMMRGWQCYALRAARLCARLTWLYTNTPLPEKGDDTIYYITPIFKPLVVFIQVVHNIQHKTNLSTQRRY